MEYVIMAIFDTYTLMDINSIKQIIVVILLIISVIFAFRSLIAFFVIRDFRTKVKRMYWNMWLASMALFMAAGFVVGNLSTIIFGWLIVTVLFVVVFFLQMWLYEIVRSMFNKKDR